MADEKAPQLPLDISIIVSSYNNFPAIELRRIITDQELIKQILSAAWTEQPVILMPVFRNKMKAIGSLIEKGIIVYNSTTKDYDFVF